MSLVAAVLAGLALASPSDPGLFAAHLRGLTGFGLGVATFVLWSRLGSRLQDLPSAPAGLTEVVMVAAVIGAIALPAHLLPVLAYDLLFAAAVLTFAAERGAVSRALRSRPLLFAGTVSYSLYMVHGLVQSLFLSGLAWLAGLLGQPGLFVPMLAPNRPGLSAEAGLAADLVGLAAIAAALIAAWVMYRLVEAPARQWSRRRAGMR